MESFSEGAFLGKRVWEMRFYPSPYLPEESEHPSIIHCQTGCLGSQHTQIYCSTRRSSLLLLYRLLPSPARDPGERFLGEAEEDLGSGCSEAGGSAGPMALQGCPLAGGDGGVSNQLL